jgi:hypothetical protein
MARTTRTTGARKAPAAKAGKTVARGTRKATSAPASAAKRTTAKAAPAAPARKTQVRRTDAQKIKIGKSIISRMKKGETMSAIAADLKLYPFQAHQLVALTKVETGKVPRIEGTGKAMLRNLIAARKVGDEYASFDYLQARSGINKVKIRKMFTDAGKPELLTDVRQSSTRQKASAERARASRAKGGARKSAARSSTRRTRPAAEPVAAKAKSTRTRATAAKASAKAAAPKPVSRRRVAANSRKVKEAASSPDAFDSKKAIDKGLEKVGAKATARKRPLRGAAAVSAEHKTSAGRKPAAPKRTRRPVNVPKGARPSAADPS